MNNFRDNNRNRGGGRDFRGRGNFGGGGDRERRRPEMHEAICSECGKRCEVPFKPTNEKPVYCSECFEKHGGSSRNSDRSSYGGGERFQERRENNFRNVEAPKSENLHKEQFDRLSAKLDIIINMLASKDEVKKVVKEVKKVVKKKVVAKKKK
jgi:CxxC-x17-CxxC domain-containing protein